MNHLCPNYKIPSRKYVKDQILQDIYNNVKEKIQNEINSAKFISFTSDGWTANTSNISFLSFTAHWINENYKQESAIIRVVPFNESHNSSNISEILQDAMNQFEIPSNKVHVILRDNAANMAAGVDLAGFQSIPCFLHTLQLVLNDAIFEQRYVKDIIATCKQIVGHFNHSPSAFAKYTEFQKKLNVPQHKFIQDIKTRWNSQYYMLSRIHEQKNALISFCSEYSKPTYLETSQWKILERLLKILQHFEDCTKFLSSRNAVVSAIIPNMKVICHFFAKGEEKGLFAGLGSTLSAWQASTKCRFNLYFNDKNLIVATYLDPRFKTTFLEEEYNGKKVEEILKEWMVNDIYAIKNREGVSIPLSQDSESSQSVDGKSDSETENDFNFNYASCFSDLTKKRKDNRKTELVKNSDSKEESITVNVKLEMVRYQNLSIIENTADPIQWWLANRDSFPEMSFLARKYLSAPPSSVESERVFSIGGILYSQKRNRMNADTGEMLMFLHYNLMKVNFDYE